MLDPVTAGVNCRVWLAFKVAVGGVSVTATTGLAAVRVIAEVADLVGSATLVAVTVTTWLVLTLEGAA